MLIGDIAEALHRPTAVIGEPLYLRVRQLRLPLAGPPFPEKAS